MKVIMFYGGRGLIEDPMLFTLKHTEKVLRELEVDVERINLYEYKGIINNLPQVMNGADGIILGTTVEWIGVGGYMQTFLDACWYFGDKEELGKVMMFPVVLSTCYGESEGEQYLRNAWNLIGGLSTQGLTGYVSNSTEFETSKETKEIIERAVEGFYRVLQKKPLQFPKSIQAVRDNLSRTGGIDFSPQETEQLSKLVNDDEYVKKQKQDIEELSNFFKQKLMVGENESKTVDPIEYILNQFKSSFKGQLGFEASYKFILADKLKNIILQVHSNGINCFVGEMESVDVVVTTTLDVMNKIVDGRMSFQRGFMTGEVTAKGSFKTLYSLDQVFKFK